VGEEDVDEQTIKDCCKDKLAGYKRPKEVVFIQPDDMPRTPTGKILHRKLREKLASETEDKE
jgi:acyl-CoA synthetase (AMP-forming)/AMP-acid ligase II